MIRVILPSHLRMHADINGEVTLPQLLHLMNGDSVVQKVASAQGRLWHRCTWGDSIILRRQSYRDIFQLQQHHDSCPQHRRQRD